MINESAPTICFVRCGGQCRGTPERLEAFVELHYKIMEVKARAPGKIILAGEHAVVHGSTAVAASVNLYTTASVRLPCSSGAHSISLTLI